jgi:hypothetical protein
VRDLAEAVNDFSAKQISKGNQPGEMLSHMRIMACASMPFLFFSCSIKEYHLG